MKTTKIKKSTNKLKMKYLLIPIIFVAILAGIIFEALYVPPSAPDPEKVLNDTFQLDQHEVVRFDTVKTAARPAYNLDSIVDYINILGRVRDLDDSQKEVEVRVLQGELPARAYDRAYKIYADYFHHVYTPALKRLQRFDAANSKRRDSL